MPLRDEITDERVHEIARAVIIELFQAVGVDASDPKELKELQLDFDHTRAWRKSTETIKSKSLGAAVVFIVTAGLAWLAYELTGRWFH
jgi:hypothetical protein